MSTLKRKDAPGDQRPAKSAKQSKNAGPSKKEDMKKVTGDQKPERPIKAPVVSLLKEEEPLFPRGGGNVLTPLEQKQIQLEAKADAIREEEFGTKPRTAKTKSKSRTKSGSKNVEHKSLEESVKVESLSFKKLVKGSLVLGQVSKIYKLGLEITLPNNLTGNVSIVSISEQMTNRLQNGAKHDSDDESESDEETDDVNLSSIYAVGQYVRTYVLSTVDTSTGSKGRRKIELSLRPQEANSGMTKDEVIQNSTVAGAITSVEDHGCVVDLGIEGKQGFLANSEIDETMDRERLQSGAVFLYQVVGGKSSSKVAQLTLQQSKLGKNSVPNDATTINTFVPGTPVTVLVSGHDRRGLTGKIMGHIDATADVVHSGVGPDAVNLDAKYKIGSKIKARVICTFPNAKNPKLGVSLLPHIISLGRKRPNASENDSTPTDVLPISSVIEECTVRHVETEIGLFVDTGIDGVSGFVHISRVKDGKVDALYESSGPFKVGSKHRARVIGYNEMDGIFHLTFEKSIIEQQYIRLEDVPIGAVVNGTIEKVAIGEEGVSGLIVKIAEGISGFVTERHLADVRLQHPEKKFREGMKVKARVLSIMMRKKQMRLTLKKTLVNSETPAIKSYDDVQVGMQALGTIVKLLPNGAYIQFYGSLKGFLPTSQMSEAHIKDPSEHFRVGQVVNVHVLDIDPERRRLVVSCKDPGAFGLEKQNALKSLRVGEIVSAKVTQKTEDQVLVELTDKQLKAVLPVSHLTDKSVSKSQFALKRITAGQTLSDLVVIDKSDSRRSIILSQKPSLVTAAKEKKLLVDFDDAKVGKVYAGYVRNITATAVFVQFGGALHALLPKARLSAEAQSSPDFGLHINGSIEVRIVSKIADLRRIMVAPASEPVEENTNQKAAKVTEPAPEDGLTLGKLATVKISSIKETQLNVKIVGTEVQGRIDVSQIFDEWDEIVDAKKPLQKFHRQDELKVKVLGVHDAKDHKFLPLSHRSYNSVLELSAKKSDLKVKAPSPLSLESLRVGETHIAYVNNVNPQFMWVNLSPQVRGRISAMEASDDLSQLDDLEANFPVGSALRVRVTAVDVEKNRLNLSARSEAASAGISWASLKKNLVLPGKVTKVNDRQIVVQLSETIAGPVHLPDIADNYDVVDTTQYKKNDIVRVSIVDIDMSNKQLRLSLRPSRTLSSTLPVADKEILSASQVSAGDIVRGFVKNVSDKGLFVLLGGQVTALVKIANLSDRYLKEWKDQFQVDELVKGRILSVEAGNGQIEMSLKSSVTDKDYTPLLTFKDIEVGQVVTGKVRKVEDFGAFIVVDDSANVSGLCHRSQMAEKPVQDARKLYKEGDAVKAKIMEVDIPKRRISFGLRPSLFEDEDSDMESGSEDGAVLAANGSDDDDDIDMENGVSLRIDEASNSEGEESEDGEDEDEEDEEDADDESDEAERMETELPKKSNGLSAGKKSEWMADPFNDSEEESEEDHEPQKREKAKNRKKAEIQVDRTADLDAHGPQTASDYERLLLGQPDSSELWIAYMAFQMQVSDLLKARETAERAIKSINIREETEKLNVWVAYLNLEVTYGNKQTVEEVFKRACQYNDEQEVHERLASIYIQSEKLKAADALFETMLKKFGAKSPMVWSNYAHFLHVTMNEPARARALLPRATQQLSKQHGQTIISRFAALEFRSPNGEPERGRTMFEGLLAAWPKKGDLWSQLVDLEMGIAGDDDSVDAAAVRDVFERRTRVKGFKPQQAEKWFRRWAAWEEKRDAKGKAKVMAKAQDWAVAYKARKEKEAAVEDEEMEDQ